MACVTVASVEPPSLPPQLSSFCLIDPNSVSVEDEALRGKVMVAIHAARANALHEEQLQSKVGSSKLVSIAFLYFKHRHQSSYLTAIQSAAAYMAITLLSLLRLSMRDMYHSTSELFLPLLSFLLRSSLYSALSCVSFYTVNVISYGLLTVFFLPSWELSWLSLLRNDTKCSMKFRR